MTRLQTLRKQAICSVVIVIRSVHLGVFQTVNDVDWYEFELTYEDIQTLTTHNDEAKTFATIFDIDYADGLRGDYGLAVFDSLMFRVS